MIGRARRPGDASRRLRTAAVIVIGLAVVVTALPLVWVAFGAFRSTADLTDPGSLAIHPTTANFSAIVEAQVPAAAGRSTLLGLAVAAIAVVFGAPAAYSIARFRTGGAPLRVGILLPTVLPPTILAFPLLALALDLRLNDSLVGVAIAHLTYVVPLVTWFMVGFFRAVPIELEEQAAVDGYGPWAAFLRVVLPNVLPGLGAAALLGFMLSWNEFFYALMLGPGGSRTLPVAIAGFNTFQGVQLGPLSAAVLVSVVPVVIFSFVVQRHLVRGMAASGVKQ